MLISLGACDVAGHQSRYWYIVHGASHTLYSVSQFSPFSGPHACQIQLATAVRWATLHALIFIFHSELPAQSTRALITASAQRVNAHRCARINHLSHWSLCPTRVSNHTHTHHLATLVACNCTLAHLATLWAKSFSHSPSILSITIGAVCSMRKPHSDEAIRRGAPLASYFLRSLTCHIAFEWIWPFTILPIELLT